MNQIEKDLKFALYGYEYIDSDIPKNKNFKKCLEQLTSFNSGIYRTAPLPKAKMTKLSEAIFNYHFQKLNREILYLPEEKIIEIYKGLPSIEELIDTFNQKAKNIDVFGLPIIYSKEKSEDGKINKLLIETTNIEILKQGKLIFTSIELGDQVDYLAPATYDHEIAHGLLERNKSSVRNYLNAEILSMFIEKLISLSISENLLKLSETNRLTDLKTQEEQIIEKDELTLTDIGAYQYLNSGFLAELLFDTYQSKNKLIQKQILRDITKVFQGELILEEFLESREISLSNNDVVKCLEKSIKEKTIKF